jgi:hypothetical protein
MPATKPVKANRQEQAKEFGAVYARLCQMLRKHEGKLSVAVEKPGTLWMEVTGAIYRGKPLYYGGVRMGKNYVSYHLMSIYMRKVPLSAELKKRMQGMTCFNFTSIDEKLFGELDKLTVDGLNDFRPEILDKELKIYQKKKTAK